ncbi:hypothetical protein ACSQ7D_11185 [Capnocytophaga sp. G1920]|uniref:hypothetical protein n=1 Tax=Capnocytophaga sp. G1920 TaxID=3448875 RepID=UPI0028E1BA2C|nr:hypothetical protein [uncultured Capnocytophaga sp.]
METKFNKEQVCELDEKALVNAFEVEELEKRYEMGWAPDTLEISGGYSETDGWNVKGGGKWNL